MRGAIPFLYMLVIFVILLAVMVVVIADRARAGISEVPQPALLAAEEEFVPPEYPMLTLNPLGIADNDRYKGNFTSTTFCEKLRACVLRSALTGSTCEVGLLSYAGTESIDNVIPLADVASALIANCPATLLSREVAPGVGQAVCKFQVNSIQKNLVSDAEGLSFEECALRPDPYNPAHAESTVTEEFKLDVQNYLSPDYFSTVDYQHKPGSSETDLKKIDTGSYLNGPGMLRIVVRAELSEGYCKFSAYTCPQPALGTVKEDSTFRVYEIFKDLEVQHMKIVPYWVRDASSEAGQIGDQNMRDLYYWATYRVNLTKGYAIRNIIDAIKTGLYDNELRRTRTPIWWYPHWHVAMDSDLPADPDKRCWRDQYDQWLKSGDESNMVRGIFYNCDDASCAGNLTVNIGLRRDWEEYDAKENEWESECSAQGIDEKDCTCSKLGLPTCTSDRLNWKHRCCDEGDVCTSVPKLSDEVDGAFGKCWKPARLSTIVAVCGR